jgi:hypothetical protein
MNLKCNGCFGGLPNAFDIGTDDAPFFQGTTPSLTVTVTLPDGVTPVNIAGAKIYLTCKKDPADSDADALFQLSTTGGAIVISTQFGATLGQFVATFASANTAALSALLSYLYDCRVILSGNVQDVLYGKITVTPSITQAIT